MCYISDFVILISTNNNKYDLKASSIYLANTLFSHRNLLYLPRKMCSTFHKLACMILVLKPSGSSHLLKANGTIAFTAYPSK